MQSNIVSQYVIYMTICALIFQSHRSVSFPRFVGFSLIMLGFETETPVIEPSQPNTALIRQKRVAHVVVAGVVWGIIGLGICLYKKCFSWLAELFSWGRRKTG